MYQVKLTNRAKKELKRIDKRYLPKIGQLLNLLSNNPFQGEKMGGQFKDSYRIKIPPLRILYTVDLTHKVINVKAVGHRQGIYK